MSTRGFLGFVVDGAEKIAYNHFDSYPGHRGTGVLAFLRHADLDAVRTLARELRVATDGDRYEDPHGEMGAILAAGVYDAARNFPADSVWCEWGYVVDFDAGVFEVYEGFQREAHTEGRFAGRPRVRPDYAPVRLVFSRPLDELPSEGEFAAAFGLEDEDDDPVEPSDEQADALTGAIASALAAPLKGAPKADVVDRIDEVLADCSVSGDAMRSRPTATTPAARMPFAPVSGPTGRLAEIAAHGNRGFTHGPGKIMCADGFTLSVIAGAGVYCTPRPMLPGLATLGFAFEDEPDPDYPGPYTEVEVGFPSERPEPWAEWARYAEDGTRPTETVYGYVPVALVQALLDHHGGETTAPRET